MVAALERSGEEVRRRRAGLPAPRLDQELPILEARGAIEEAIAGHRVVVVCGETGSGKTTQLPQICLKMGRGAAGMIAHTQPRRIAARAVAARIAEELGVPLGREVGVKVRFMDQTSDATAVKLMTDGLLLAEARADHLLSRYDTVIVDEAHERSVNIDFLLGYLHRLVEVRDDLKVIITSATIDAERFARHFEHDGKPAPVIEVSGRMYPVEVRHRPAGVFDADGLDLDGLAKAVRDAVEELLGPRGCAVAGVGGDVLVFLPGEREIRAAAEQLARGGCDAEVLQLYSRMSVAEQDRIFRVVKGRRRVILATNIAETSLTVPGITGVVDSGLARISRYDEQSKVQRLPVEAVSKASLRQRSGRCGRIAPGVCVRLFSEADEKARAEFTQPEIARSNLSSVLLQLKALELGPVAGFPFLDPPDPRLVRDGLESLFELGAIGAPREDAAITPVGRELSQLPVDPAIGRIMLAGAEEGVLEEAVTLAAALSIQDPRERPRAKQTEADQVHALFAHEDSDFVSLLRVWSSYEEERGGAGWCREHFLSVARMREWAELREQLWRVAEETGLAARAGGGGADDEPKRPERQRYERLHRALIAGLIRNVCRREDSSGGRSYNSVRGEAPAIFPGSALFKSTPKWIVAAEIVETSRLFARTLATVEAEWVLDVAKHLIKATAVDPHFDRAAGRAAAWRRVMFGKLVLVAREEAPLAEVDRDAARRMFVLHGLVRGEGPDLGAAAAPVRRVMGMGAEAMARLRRRDVVRPEEELIGCIGARLPDEVVDAETFVAWAGRAGTAADAIKIDAGEVLTDAAAGAMDDARFPVTLEGVTNSRFEYRWEAGKETDGVTLAVGLLELTDVSTERVDWLVPGWLGEKNAALLKNLPKAERARIEKVAAVERVAVDAAEVMAFGEGSYWEALSEAVEVLTGVRVEPGAWPRKALPLHLVMRIEVRDDGGKVIAAERDVAALRERLAGRIEKAKAAAARRRFGREGVTAWDFGELPETIEADGDVMAPAIIDRGASVAVTVSADRELAAALTYGGIRRLYAIACREEVVHHIAAMAQLAEMKRWHASMASADQLEDALLVRVAERCFMIGQPLPTTREAFDATLQGSWGMLAAAAAEVGGLFAGFLEPRFRVAGRFAGGTGRLWAASVADMREQGAYLMPPGFLHDAPWARLREYPRYVGGMWERLRRLRDEGLSTDQAGMQMVSPLWKRFTAWVAAAMAAERAAEAERGGEAKSKTVAKSALPPARRAAPTVNADAAAWAMGPAALPAKVAEYRWAVEELRLATFLPGHALTRGGRTVSKGELEKLAGAWPKGRVVPV